MMQLALFALLAWVPAVILLFIMLPPRRAVIAAFLGGWMFLPLMTVKFEGMPDLSKVSITSATVLLAVAAFDGARLLSFRPRWFDLPMLVWVVVPFIASVVNQRGMYDGGSRVLTAILYWGIPYLIGRLYFTDLIAMRELAIGLFLAGLIYMPLVLWEIRMSPQLHNQLYGFRASGMLRGGGLGLPGYRPNVFIGHGLQLSMFMLMSTIAGFWLWKTKALRELWGLPTGLLVAGLWGTVILCKVLGAILLLHLGMVALSSTRWLRTSAIVLMLIVMPVLYMVTRTTGAFTGETLLSFAQVIDADRAASLQFRLDAEGNIIRNAMEKPAFGYGSDPQWRARLSEDPNAKAVVTDGMWIIALGQAGLVGLIAFTLLLLVPPLLIWRRMPVAFWEHPAFAPVVGLAVLMVCFMIDSLFNATLSMVSLLVAGAVGSMVPLMRPNGGASTVATGAPSRVRANLLRQAQVRPPRRRPTAYAS
ncbi:MAG TPA: hypothetical protein VGR35_00120 [Tepidisphaeraceae bacterium]|nr:hypothetical protein [Tepidisphaeraceae bacterium]